MSQGRPDILFPLFADLTGLPGVGAKTAKLFEKIGAARIVDLLLTLPTGIEDRRIRDSLHGIRSGEVATVSVDIVEHRPGRTSSQPYRVIVDGGETVFTLVYFRAKRDWLEKLLPPGGRRVVSGRVEFYDGHLQMPHPDLALSEREAEGLRPWQPVYPLTQGLFQRQVAKAMSGALQRLPDLDEWIAPAVMRDRHWPGWSSAIRLAHAPDGPEALSSGNPARQRLAYDELLSHQLALQLVRARMKRGKGQVNRGDGTLRDLA
ncbi:MAG: ATP-dependent DNA helicase RecG, partial [Pseudomonadota bacterium]